MRNLLEETRTILEVNGKTFKDIVWVGNSDYKIELVDFIRLADFEYDAGYGSEEVKTDLMVVGNDWWLARENYDGMEWWSFNTIPDEPTEFRTPTTLETHTIYGYYPYMFEEEMYID